MRTYDFENITIPLYEHIYKCIKEDIINGVFPAGEKLPSKRSFAENNGVSTITVQNAYEQLISEGYIFSIPKKGYYVADIRKNNIPENIKKEDISSAIDLPQNGNNIEIDLSNNFTNPEMFPFSVWSKIMRRLLAEKQESLMTTVDIGGVGELRNAIAQHLKSFKGMTVDPRQIIIGAGTEYLYGLLIQLLGNDKTYCIENPGYGKLPQIYNLHKVNCCLGNIDNNGIMVEELIRNNAQIAHISPAHHFPTGITMSAPRRYEILEWANKAEDRYIIEDDYDSEFRQNGKPIPPMQSMDRNEKVIYMNTFSKSLTPTIRISYMVLPVHLINEFYKKLGFYNCTVSTFGQYALAEFIAEGYFEKHINRMRLYYRKKQQEIINIIRNSEIKDRCIIVDNSSGLHFLLELKTAHKDKYIAEKLMEHGISFKALSDYYLDKKERNLHAFLLNYSNVSSDKVRYALTVIGDVL